MKMDSNVPGCDIILQQGPQTHAAMLAVKTPGAEFGNTMVVIRAIWASQHIAQLAQQDGKEEERPQHLHRRHLLAATPTMSKF